MCRLSAAAAAILVCLALGGMPALAQEASESPASACPPGSLPAASLDPSLVADADGFIYEVIAPGVRRLLDDGAGHQPSARYICEARDMDLVAVDADGSIVVWSTPHGIDNWRGRREVWILGREGTAAADLYPVPDEPTVDVTAPDGSRWQLKGGSRGLTRSVAGSREWFLQGQRTDSLAVAPDGRVWVVAGHGDREAGGIFVIEPGAHGSQLPQEKVCGQGTGTLTVSISDLVGMEGLELTARAGAADVELFDLVIDGSPFETTDSCRIEPGMVHLAVAVGEPPCAWVYGPLCAGAADYLYHCDTLFEAAPGEDVWIWISGLPAAAQANAGGCPIVSISHRDTGWLP